MDRTSEDKLMSNVSTLKNELDNFYLNGLTPEVTELATRICEIAGGHSVELQAAELNRKRANALARRVQELEAQATWTDTELEPTETLGPCPFCGGPAKLYVSELASVPELEPSYYVECQDCGSQGPGFDDVFKSERYWNNACKEER